MNLCQIFALYLKQHLLARFSNGPFVDDARDRQFLDSIIWTLQNRCNDGSDEGSFFNKEEADVGSMIKAIEEGHINFNEVPCNMLESVLKQYLSRKPKLISGDVANNLLSACSLYVEEGQLQLA